MQVVQKIVVVAISGVCASAFAYTPQAPAYKYGIFLDSVPYSIPSGFWKHEGNSHNRVLLPTSGKAHIESISSFKNALMTRIQNVAYERMYKGYYQGYPSVYEYRNPEAAVSKSKNKTDPENQCVAFVKLMTGNTTNTGSWYAGANVMTQQNSGSDAHRGKMVGFFRNPNVAYNKQSGDAHVGIFLGYGHNGFWIADENWSGTGQNPKGEIRKHFISVTGRYASPTNANSYYFVDIR